MIGCGDVVVVDRACRLPADEDLDRHPAEGGTDVVISQPPDSPDGGLVGDVANNRHREQRKVVGIVDLQWRRRRERVVRVCVKRRSELPHSLLDRRRAHVISYDYDLYGVVPADEFSIPGAESQQAFDVLLERFPQQSGDVATVVIHSSAGIESADTRERVQELMTRFGELPGVTSVASPYDVPGSVSQDGTIARFDVRYAEPAFEVDAKHIEELFDLRAEVSVGDLKVELGGPVAVVGEIEPPGESELIGFIAAMVILLVAFGSVVAMGLPILTALMGLIPGFMIIGIASAVLASITLC